MANFFYTLFIFPIEFIIETVFVVSTQMLGNPVLSIFAVSFVVTLLTLPLYLMAEQQQQLEHQAQAQMKKVVTNLKAVFTGDERFMRLSTYYRQNHYHPLYYLRTSVPLLIQVPFFIAAYHYLSHLNLLQGIAFGPIADIARPDSLLKLSNFSVNVLPFVMTFINMASSALYTKGFSWGDKLKLYGMALLFLVLLYNAPSALVLYWTSNNVLSLVKNIIQHSKNPQKWLMVLFYGFFGAIVGYLLLKLVKDPYNFGVYKRTLLAFFILISLLPTLWHFTKRYFRSFYKSVLLQQETSLFPLSAFILALLLGLVIPSALISTGVEQFSFIGNYKTPFPFIFHSLLQATALFVVWPVAIYAISSNKVKNVLSLIAVITVAVALVNTYLFKGNNGVLTLGFHLTAVDRTAETSFALVNFGFLLLTLVVCLWVGWRFKQALKALLTIALLALAVVGAINLVTIYKGFKDLASATKETNIEVTEQSDKKPLYQLSKTGKNVMVILLDRALGKFVPYLFEEKPELYQDFNGFTWYPNSTSSGQSSILGTPALYGGYEYTPWAMNQRSDVPLKDKHNEALLLLPVLFDEQGFKVSVSDPSLSNYKWFYDISIFKPYPNIRVSNIIEQPRAGWLPQGVREHDLDVVKDTLIRFSLFRVAPPFVRGILYDNGLWLSTANTIFSGGGFQSTRPNPETPRAFAMLDHLKELTQVITEGNTYNSLYNDLPHRPSFLSRPNYQLMQTVVQALPHQDRDYDAMMASLLLLGKYFTFLKEEGVYNNTRIIIVSDHGNGVTGFPFDDNFSLPKGRRNNEFNVLLMVKDFNSTGDLMTNNSFMSNADVPLLALENIIDNPINPFTGEALVSNKTEGIIITLSGLFQPEQSGKYQFDIKNDEWIKVKDDIFVRENWADFYPNKE